MMLLPLKQRRARGPCRQPHHRRAPLRIASHLITARTRRATAQLAATPPSKQPDTRTQPPRSVRPPVERHRRRLLPPPRRRVRSGRGRVTPLAALLLRAQAIAAGQSTPAGAARQAHCRAGERHGARATLQAEAAALGADAGGGGCLSGALASVPEWWPCRALASRLSARRRAALPLDTAARGRTASQLPSGVDGTSFTVHPWQPWAVRS